jgi:hypothetical protein
MADTLRSGASWRWAVLALALFASACGGSASQSESVDASSATVTSTTEVAAGADEAEDVPAQEAEDGQEAETAQSAAVDPEAVHYVAAIEGPATPGWSRITGLPVPTFFVDGVLPERFELGYHSLLVLDSCLTLPADVDPKTRIEEAGLQIPDDLEGPLCESLVTLETIALATGATSTIENLGDRYLITVPPLAPVTSLYITDSQGNHYTQSAEGMNVASLRIEVFPDRLEGTFVTPDGQFVGSIEGGRTDWAAPFTVERAQQAADWGAKAPLEIPQISSLVEPPAEGITVVWFECGLTSPTVNQFCVDETAEIRRATDALGWELQVVQSTTTYHGSEAAVPYREALQFDGDVYIPRGFSQGGWSQSDVNGLLAGGAKIIDNGFDGNVDLGPWNTLESQRETFPPPFIEAWMLADAGAPFTFGGDANALPVSDPRSFCGACIWVPIPYQSDLEQILADWPDIEYLRLGWEDEVAGDLLADYTVVNLPGFAAAWVEPAAGLGAPAKSHGLERPWYLIDLAIRALVSDEPLAETYWLPEYRLFFEGEEPSLTDEFRAAFLEAWGVAG